MIPIINFDPVPPTPPTNPGMPMISISEAPSSETGGRGPQQSQMQTPNIQVFEIPGMSVSGPEFEEYPPKNGGPQISVNGGQNHHGRNNHQPQQARFVNHDGGSTPARQGGGLSCGGCPQPIKGRIVSAMGVRWHPDCFRCTVCKELLEHVSSYEHDGRPYCHLDYHEVFVKSACIPVVVAYSDSLLEIRSEVLLVQDCHYRGAIHQSR